MMKQRYNKITRLLFCVSLAILLSSCTTTIYLVRHGEKLNNAPDTPLSISGFQRADVLRDSLFNKGIDSVFVSTFLRTQQTADPLCEALHKDPVIYNKDTTAQFARNLKKIKGKNILVVGHSDNIPQMVYLIANRMVSIPDTVFNKMFIITISRSLTTTIRYREITYGAPSPE